LLVGEVAGVLSVDPASGKQGQLIAEIALDRLPVLARALGGSRGVDVTGGMVAKVTAMAEMMRATPVTSAVQIFSGLVPGLVYTALINPDAAVGTRILKHAVEDVCQITGLRV
jgi:isopentenyl phosphate kinase